MGSVRDRVPPRGVWVTTRTLFPRSTSRFTLLKGNKRTSDMLFWTHFFISQSCLHLHFKCWILQGCTLAVLSGPWCLTFALRWLENLHFFVQIICWAPWISQGQSTALMQLNQTCLTCFFFLKMFFFYIKILYSVALLSVSLSISILHSHKEKSLAKSTDKIWVLQGKKQYLIRNNICSEAQHLKPQLSKSLIDGQFSFKHNLRFGISSQGW